MIVYLVGYGDGDRCMDGVDEDVMLQCNHRLLMGADSSTSVHAKTVHKVMPSAFWC